jgi:hypothetical protein
MFNARLRGGVRLVFSWAALALAAYLNAGCATDPAQATHPFPPPPTQEVRSSLKQILVVSATSEARSYFAKPDTSGKAAGKGALLGMATVGQAMGHTSSGIGVLVVVFALPVGAAVGAISGGMHGTSKEEIAAVEKILTRAFSEMDFQTAIRGQVVEAGRKNTRREFILNELSPATPDGRHTDAILEVTVLSAGLAGRGEKGAPLTMFLKVQVRLVKSAAEQPIYSNTWVQTSGARPFREWGENDGQAFRKELGNATRAVAESIIEELFLAYRPARN